MRTLFIIYLVLTPLHSLNAQICYETLSKHDFLSKQVKTQLPKTSIIDSEMAHKITKKYYSDDQFPSRYTMEYCYIRAHKIAKDLEESGIIAFKVFALKDNLAKEQATMGVKNPFSLFGHHSEWSYHVATAVLTREDDREKIMVIDPSLSTHALTMEEWARGFISLPSLESGSINFEISPRYSFTKEDRKKMVNWSKKDLKRTKRLLGKMNFDLKVIDFIQDNPGKLIFLASTPGLGVLYFLFIEE